MSVRGVCVCVCLFMCVCVCVCVCVCACVLMSDYRHILLHVLIRAVVD